MDTVIEIERKYSGNRTVSNLISIIDYNNALQDLDIHSLIKRYNSYKGFFLLHTNSYAVRYNI